MVPCPEDYARAALHRRATGLAAFNGMDLLPLSRTCAAIHCAAVQPMALRVVLDTLRIADRLKRFGFERRQAEGMARVLSEEMSELIGRLVTRSDLATEIGTVRSDFTDLRSDFTALRSDFTALDARLTARIDALNAKVDALSTQIRFIFAILAVLLALGIIDTVPGLLG